MNRALGQMLSEHIIPIRDEWTQRLRNESAQSALGRQHTVEFLVEATLTQLLHGFSGSGQHWLQHCAPLAGPVHQHCACGLPAVQRYFEAGKEALRAVLAPEMGADIETLVGRLQQLAQHEVRSLCQPCPRLGSSVCVLGAATGEAKSA